MGLYSTLYVGVALKLQSKNKLRDFQEIVEERLTPHSEDCLTWTPNFSDEAQQVRVLHTECSGHTSINLELDDIDVQSLKSRFFEIFEDLLKKIDKADIDYEIIFGAFAWPH